MSKKILALGLVLALAAVMVIPVAVSAAGTDTATVSGTVAFSIDVTIPDTISLGTPMIVGDNPSGAKTLHVVANGNWKVDAADLANGGYMKDSSTPLTNKLQISKDNVTYSGADSAIQYTGSSTTGTDLNFYAKQTVAASDAVGSYSITITFTGAANP